LTLLHQQLFVVQVSLNVPPQLFLELTFVHVLLQRTFQPTTFFALRQLALKLTTLDFGWRQVVLHIFFLVLLFLSILQISLLVFRRPSRQLTFMLVLQQPYLPHALINSQVQPTLRRIFFLVLL
jgi:hypothetical protein